MSEQRADTSGGKRFPPHPQPLPPQPEGIPSELRDTPQWVAWRYEYRGGKWTKPPVNPHTGARAKSTAPATWSTFDHTLDYARDRLINPGRGGVGFVVTERDPFLGIDIDGCRNPVTGDVTPGARSIVAALDSYTEISPSGTGLRIIIRAKLRAGSRNRSDTIEIYDRARFFTLTGHRYGDTPAAVCERQAALDELHGRLFSTVPAPPVPIAAYLAMDDETIIQRAHNARNGGKFGQLWAGDTSAYNGDDSAADVALCRLLAWWTGPDVSRIERLFARSGLVREKWTKRADYRRRTIAKALSEMKEFYQPSASAPGRRSSQRTTGTATATSAAPHGAVAGIKPAPVSGEEIPDYRTIGIVPALAAVIERTDHFATDAGGKLYIYRDGVYIANGERSVIARTRELLDAWGESRKWSTHRAKETAAYIATRAPALCERPPSDRINVKNGLVDLHDPKHPRLLPHSPEFLSVVQLPVIFDPNATCPAWETFVGETFPTDAYDLAWEIPADLMLPDRSDQRAILLVGEGSNGKSTYLRGVRAFIGKRNVAGKSLHKLESDRFAVAGLFGKLANICADLPSAHLETTSMFKMITGGDTLDGEYKHLNAFEFDAFARLIFSANHYPRSADSSHAFFRRWVILPFERTFEGKAATPSAVLDARLAHPRELSGVLNKAIAALPQLRRRGFTVSPSMQQAWEEFRGETDPLAVWLDFATETDPDGFIPRAVLRKAYADHCREAGHPTISDTAFGSAMRRLRPALPFKQRVVDGKAGVWCYLGVSLKASDPSHGVHRVNRVPLNYSAKSGSEPSDEAGGEKVAPIKHNPVNPVNPVGQEITAGAPVSDPLAEEAPPEMTLWQWVSAVKAGRASDYPMHIQRAAQHVGFTLDTFAPVEVSADRLAAHLDQRAAEEGNRG